MKRLPLAASFVLFILLCASLAYWGLQLFKPPLRPVAAPPRAAQETIHPEAASGLFGGRAGGVAASNYQLKGVIFSGNPHDSVAILSADGKPAQAVRAGNEFLPDVKVREVHRDYVLLAEGGTVKRVDLPENAPKELGAATTAPVPVQRTPTPPPPPPVTGVPSRAQTAAAGGVPAPVAPPGAVQSGQSAATQSSTQGTGQAATSAPPTVVVSPPPTAQPNPVPAPVQPQQGAAPASGQQSPPPQQQTLPTQ